MRHFFARFALELAVFICGALVMVYEIIGSRIVAPHIGTSTYVWTSLIGVILAALSVGYWLGGRIADKWPDVKVLALVIFLAGGLVSLTVLLKEVVLAMIASAAGPLEVKAVAAAALLFAPASVLLGFVTPYSVKLRTISLEDSGKTVGRLYALSTVGSIVGTFAAGFILIPFVGSTRTLYIIAGSLFAVSLILAPLAFNRATFTSLTVFILGIAGSELTSYLMYKTQGLVDLDTEYGRVQIYETTHPETKRRYRAIATDPYFAQSAMYLDDGSPVFEYVKFFHLVDHFKPDHSRALLIGGAGYTFPKEYLKTYPDAIIDVVEIDPQMTEIARRHFNVNYDERLNIVHEDGRVFLGQAGASVYDAVMIDAFGSLFSIPYQLTTREAIYDAHRILKYDGVVLVNIGSAITGSAGLFLRAEYETYRSVFADVALFKVRSEKADHELQNVVLIACKSSCDGKRSNTSKTANYSELLERRYTNTLPILAESPGILTDDLAPVEYYNSVALRSFVR